MIKKPFLLLSTLVLLLACSKEETPDHSDQYISIPGQKFEHELLDLGIDSEKVLDGRILKSDALKVKTLILDGKDNPGRERFYHDIRGIEGFINIEVFEAKNIQQDIIKVDALPKLKRLIIQDGDIENLILTNAVNLEYLSVNKTSGLRMEKDLDFSNCVNLKEVNISWWDLKSPLLDLSKLKKLESVYIVSSPISFVKLPEDGLPNLHSLTISTAFNGITSIDLDKCPQLRKLFISAELEGIDLSNNILLEFLDLDTNKLDELDLSHNFNLKRLIMRRNEGNLSCIKIASGHQFDYVLLPDGVSLNENCN